MERYQFLFPFEKIARGSRILIYGAGNMGQAYYQQLLITGYADCIGFIDQEWRDYKGSYPIVYGIEQIKELQYDVILVALKVVKRAMLVMEDLKGIGIEPEKLIYVPVREYAPFMLHRSTIDGAPVSAQKYAYEVAELSIAIRLGNGIGSAVIKKCIYEEMHRLFPQAKIDLYSMIKKDDLQAIYGAEPSLNTIFHENGNLYKTQREHYTIAINTLNCILLDHANFDYLEKNYPEEAKRFYRLDHFCKTDAGNPSRHLNFIHINRALYRGEDCYTVFSARGIFDIHDRTIHLSLNDDWRAEFDALHLHHYITLNYGNGQSMTQAEAVDKQWPFAYFQEVVRKIKEQYPDIEIVQLGAPGAQLLDGVDHYLFGKNLELIKYVLKHAIFHLDIEGGLVHLASQLGTKCIVLFGPTRKEFYGYKNNINLTAGNCHGCCQLYEDAFHCARDMEKPECMYSITPEMVMEAVRGYLNEIKEEIQDEEQ